MGGCEQPIWTTLRHVNVATAQQYIKVRNLKVEVEMQLPDCAVCACRARTGIRQSNRAKLVVLFNIHPQRARSSVGRAMPF
jgi:hypothetical protein